MAFRQRAAGAAEDRDNAIPRLDRAGGRARLIGAARAIHFARCDARDPDPRAFGAPHGPVAVIDGHRRASERLPGWHRRCFCASSFGGEEKRQGGYRKR